MVREYLIKLQDLQLRAFDKGINMEIVTRRGAKGEQWIVSYMFMEGCSFSKEPKEMHPEAYIDYCTWQTEDRNRARLDEMLEVFEDFIKKHGK